LNEDEFSMLFEEVYSMIEKRYIHEMVSGKIASTVRKAKSLRTILCWLGRRKILLR
jgi:hypothetical protein